MAPNPIILRYHFGNFCIKGLNSDSRCWVSYRQTAYQERLYAVNGRGHPGTVPTQILGCNEMWILIMTLVLHERWNSYTIKLYTLSCFYSGQHYKQKFVILQYTFIVQYIITNDNKLEAWTKNFMFVWDRGAPSERVAPISSKTILLHCVSKNVLTLKRYSSKLQGAILMKFGRNIQNTLEWSLYASVFM